MFISQPPERFLPMQVELSNSIRRSWMDLARYLRSLILSYTLNLGNQAAIEERLKGIATGAQTQFSQFYGPQVGDRIKQIYLDYFHSVHELIKAYLANNQEDIRLYRELMYGNADEVSQLLASVNRYWDRATLQAMLYVLVNDTEKQIANLVSGNYVQDVESYDEYVDEIYRISDELTYGLFQQFRI